MVDKSRRCYMCGKPIGGEPIRTLEVHEQCWPDYLALRREDARPAPVMDAPTIEKLADMEGVT